MMKLFIAFFLTGCVEIANAEQASLAWWMLPEISNDLPHEAELDDSGRWIELWVRPKGEVIAPPTTVMEQAPAVRWVGMNPDKEGKPTKTILVMADKRIVEFNGESAKLGTIDGDVVIWADGTKTSLVEFKKKKRRRRSRAVSTRIKFGKIVLPPIGVQEQTLPEWSVEGISRLLKKVAAFPEVPVSTRDYSAISQLEDPHGGALGFKYSNSCSMKERAFIEDVLMNQVEPRLTCWMDQDKEGASRLLAVLMQHPTIECRIRPPMGVDHCGMATMPLAGEFFVKRPRINLAMERCRGELPGTLIHETFHLAGLRDGSPLIDRAVEQSESCSTIPARLSFANAGEGFLNDFQVETRIFLFRKVREESVEKWGWTEGERAFFLGVICQKMGDQFCARNYFQKAAGLRLPGSVELPEGGEIPWATLAQFNFYDSIPEDLQRMRELARYLQRDPHGTLLRRLETGTHRLHEFFIARTTLLAVQNNKGVCNGDTDERVLCEDLAQIIKTPWFRQPNKAK